MQSHKIQEKEGAILVKMRIKELCKMKDLPRRYLVDQLNVESSTVDKWFTGENIPRADKLPKLAQLLGCTIDELFEKEA